MVEGKCNFFLAKKNRNCRMEAKKGERFCCEHLISESQSDRIPCPVDQTHTVFLKNLEKHLKVCNFVKRQSLIKHFSENINLEQNESSVLYFSLAELKTPEDFSFYFAIIERLYDHYISKFPLNSTPHSQQPIIHCSKSQKHIFQHQALYDLMGESGFIEDSTTFVELCAGKGDLSKYLATNAIEKKVQNFSFALVDYDNFKNKKDVYLKNNSIPYRRLQIDIKNLDTNDLLSELKAEKCVFYAKHACGKATDVSFSCVQKAIQANTFKGLCLAFCCHHRTDWKSFYGSKSLAQMVENPQQIFDLLKQMSSWATCGKNPNNCEHPCGLPTSAREVIGWKCKRIIDFARVDSLLEGIPEFCRKVQAEFLEYTPLKVTLENVCLVLTLKI